LLDDGFQHRKIRRELDIVCIDATDDFKGAQMLPSGRLREPLAGLKRAGAIVITRANLVNNVQTLRAEIAEIVADVPVFVAENEISNIIELEELHADSKSSLSNILAKKAFAFCGIGNAGSFFEQLRREKINVSGTKAFRDHHIYSQNDVTEIERQSREAAADILLTTAKDAVKLKTLTFKIPVFVVEIEMVLDDADAFRALV
jgi:tetraacyldisaccharide 4'-kinase